jgi:hypothetical protein
MNAHKLAATVSEDGQLVLTDLPFHPGTTVEVIILESSNPKASETNPTEPAKNLYPLQNKQPYRYEDPFSPAVSPEDWEVLK